MTREEWRKIIRSSKLLGLDERASLKEIKQAYRKASKKYHPDTASKKQKKGTIITMSDIIEAYDILIDYCSNYKYPLVPGADEAMDAEDWWMDRFGHDPLWSKP